MDVPVRQVYCFPMKKSFSDIKVVVDKNTDSRNVVLFGDKYVAPYKYDYSPHWGRS